MCVYMQVYMCSIYMYMHRSAKKKKLKATRPPVPNEPKYSVKYRGEVAMGDYTNDRVSRVIKRPKEIVVIVELPGVVGWRERERGGGTHTHTHTHTVCTLPPLSPSPSPSVCVCVCMCVCSCQRQWWNSMC